MLRSSRSAKQPMHAGAAARTSALIVALSLALAVGIAGPGPGDAVAVTTTPAATPLIAARVDPAAARIDLLLDAAALASTGDPAGAGLPVRVQVRVQVRVDPDLEIEAVTPVRFTAGAKLATGGSGPATPNEPEATGAGPAVAGPAATWRELGWCRGQRLIEVAVQPWRRRPATGTVEFARELVLELRGSRDPARAAARLAPRSVPWEWKAERGLASTTLDLRSADPAASGAAAAALHEPAGGDPQGFSPTFRPSTDGSPVEYVILTTEAMAAAYQPLADWKTRRGVQAVVRTVEWVQQTYPNGVDRAEQVRFFLRDAYLHWGTLWVLLGGDTEVLPVRYALSTVAEPDELIPTDLYYACLDGNWNADGDAVFGEATGDEADLLPELYVGRAPTVTANDAADFAGKVIAYESTPPVDPLYPASMMLLGEQLTPLLDGADYCEAVRASIPPAFRTVRMYENHSQYPGSLPENEFAVVDSLNSGFGVVLHVGHGFRTTMSVGSGSLDNGEINQLHNGPRQSVVYAINCSSAAIDFNAIGERFIKNPGGGGVAYIGSTRLTSVGATQDFQLEFFRLAFEDTVVAVGQALALSKVPFAGTAQGENLVRWMTFALLLLGDPELAVWHRAPEPIVVDHPPTYELGSGSFALHATVGGGVPLAGARATLWQGSDELVSETTGGGGDAALAFQPGATGDFSVTVHRAGYVPYAGSATTVGTQEPFVHLQALVVDDDSAGASQGNGDGVADGGETVELRLTLENAGGGAASGVTAVLSSPDAGPDLAILGDTVAYGELAPGGASSGNGAFLLQLDAAAPDAFQPRFALSVTASGSGGWDDDFVVPVYAVGFEHFQHQLDDPLPGGNDNGVPEPGEALTYAVTLRNIGTGSAEAVTGSLRVVDAATLEPSPEATVEVAAVDYGTIAPRGLATGNGAFAFTLSPQAVIDDLRLELTWADRYGVRAVERDDLLPPALVTDLAARGSQSTITLSWMRPADTDVKGYDVYRSSNPFDNFDRINAFTADGSALYEDAGLPGLTRFYYYVVARDSSYNASVPSAMISATTNPPLAEGWPIETGQPSSSGVVIDDLEGDGALELVTGADAVYAWHADGSEVRDGDDNPQTSGVFTLDGQDGEFGFHATPALADLDGDGALEIIAEAWHAAQVFVWDRNGTAQPGWPQPIGGDFNWASPAVDDLDRDGDLEIVAVSGLQGIIYAWHHDGTELVDGDGNPATNGVFFDTPSSFLYASPALGNLAGDADLEIVVATNSINGMVYAFDAAGQPLPGWPYEAGGQVTASPALADLDDDGYQEVIFAAEDDSVYVVGGDGTDLHGWPQRAETNTDFGHTSSVAVGDIDGDGEPDLAYGSSSGRMVVLDRFGDVLFGWDEVRFAQEALPAGATQCTPTIADIDGDGQVEIVLGAEDGLVYGWNHDGSEAAGFPITIGGEIRGAVSLWDLDQDGRMEMTLIANDRNVYVWKLPGEVHGDRLGWPFFRHDARNTGRVDAPFTSIGVADPGGSAAGGAARRARLLPAAPNPFNPATVLRFVVPGERGAARPVRLAIYDVQGRLVRVLVDGPVAAGPVAVRWDGRDEHGRHAASGAYFIRYAVAGAVLTGKLVMLK